MGKGKVIFLKNAALLTSTGLFLRMVGMFFRVWMASSIGAEGMGLYQQIFSIYALTSVFASSGVSLAVTRLISEELTVGKRRGIDMIIARSILLTLAVAFISGIVVFLSASPISVYIMSDNRAVDSLKIMVFSLPFMGVSSVFKGYFFARKKAFPHSSSQILEQAVRIGFIMWVFGSLHIDAQSGCAAVLCGDVIAEFSSAAYLTVFFLSDRKRLKTLSGRDRPPYRIMGNLIRIVSPIASGKYLNSFLRTIENILVPSKLVSYGLTRELALSNFGMIKGMALPVLLFPAGFLSSLTSLLIPEISEASVSGNKARIRYAAEKSISVTFVSAIPVAVLFYFIAEPLTVLIYNDISVGFMVKILAPLVPFMYIDSVSDALLKALDFQTVTFRHAILDSLGRIALIILALPKLGMAGFIGIMYVSNLFTSLMNLRKLIKESGAKIKVFQTVISPLLLSLTGGLLADVLSGMLKCNELVYIMFLLVGVLLACAPLLSLFGLIDKEKTSKKLKRR